ncbi:MAG: efflux RND transporter periplasmic adaptor subunit [Tumebacillaceae bacterium]
MNRFGKRLGLLLCWTLACAPLSGCGTKQRAAEQPAAVPVSTYRVTAHDLPETLLLPGRIMPHEQIPVVATVPGKVARVYVNPGDTVQAGQLLAALETASGQSDLQEARRTLQELEAQAAAFQKSTSLRPTADDQQIAALEAQMQGHLQRLLTTLKRTDAASQAVLMKEGQELLHLQSDSSRLQAQAMMSAQMSVLRVPMLTGLQAQVAQARQAVKMAQIQLDAARLTAPIAGTVLSKLATPGMPAGPGTPLFQIGDLSAVQLEIPVDPNLEPRLQKGQPVSIQVTGQPLIHTFLTDLSPSLDPQAKAFLATASLPNTGGVLKPGMTGQATITLSPHQGVLAVPTAAVLEDNKGKFVMVVRAGKAQRQNVETGYSNGTWTEIRKGLGKQAEIIVEGISRVQEGSRVEIVRQEPTS